jgi:hypothetical protein
LNGTKIVIGDKNEREFKESTNVVYKELPGSYVA